VASDLNVPPAPQQLEVVVVGAGQAGLAIGYHLRERGRRFVILERGQVGETWRSQRWDTFVVNTPNWLSALPGAPYDGPAPDGFYTTEEWVGYLGAYARRFSLPVRAGWEVTSVAPAPEGFLVHGTVADGSAFVLSARAVVAAAGVLNSPRLPSLSRDLPPDLDQLHAADYRSAADLPEGAILVVGGGQSGCQIAEDLIEASRTVYLSASKVGRVPRRYRGRDVMKWMLDTGFWDVRLDDLDDPEIAQLPQPQLSGIGAFGHTLSLQHLASKGVILMGRITGIEDGVLVTDGRLAEYVAYADEFSAKVKADIDAYIAAERIDAPRPEDDPADVPSPGELAGSVERLDLRVTGVTAVIWCTGFTSDFGWLEVPVLDEAGRPVHRRGVSSVPGLYFLGFPWLHSRKSGVIPGVDEDGAHIADSIDAYLG
jgi:putative flavoprotein involved in K+ transport